MQAQNTHSVLSTASLFSLLSLCLTFSTQKKSFPAAMDTEHKALPLFDKRVFPVTSYGGAPPPFSKN